MNRTRPKLKIRKFRDHPKKQKPKKDALPMKQRALPHSFWQQPNRSRTAPPGIEYFDVASKASDIDKNKSEVVSDANTDLLFSLFQEVDSAETNRQHSSLDTKVLRDEDPFLISNVGDFVLTKRNLQIRVENAKKHWLVQSKCGATLDHSNDYSKILSDLVVQL